MLIQSAPLFDMAEFRFKGDILTYEGSMVYPIRYSGYFVITEFDIAGVDCIYQRDTLLGCFDRRRLTTASRLLFVR